MKWFKCYLLDDRDKITGVRDLEAGDDAGAMIMAAEVLERETTCVGVEIRDGARRVGSLAHSHLTAALSDLPLNG